MSRLVVGNIYADPPTLTVTPASLLAYISDNGYRRSETVNDPGEFAVRGGIVDLFPAGAELPLRCDFFGDDLESLRSFDPLTQMSLEKSGAVTLLPMSEQRLPQPVRCCPW